MGKKGQVTLFVIIAVVLLFGATLIISQASNSYEARLQEQATSDLTEYLKLNSINTYVASCIKTVTEDALILVGEQGGVIYTDQGGLTNISELEEGEDYLIYDENKIDSNRTINVSYGITDGITCGNYVAYSDVDDLTVESLSFYPVKDLYFKDYRSDFFKAQSKGGCNGLTPSVYTSGFVGNNTLESLCTASSLGSVACRLNALNNTNFNVSIQSQIESYVENNIMDCVNFSLFDFTGNNITYDSNDEMNTEIIFKRPDGLTVFTYFPFKVRVGDDTVITSAEFREDINVNFKRLYYFLYDLIFEFVKNPSINIEEDWNSDKWSHAQLLETFELEVVKAPCSYSNKCSNGFYDDIVIVSDKSIYVGGRPFEFIFAVQQRAPILEFLHDPYVNMVYDGKELDYLFHVNQTIFFSDGLLGVDSDNDILKFNYSGWREDYTTTFDFDKCREEGCSLETHGEYMTTEEVPTYNWTGYVDFNYSIGYSEYHTDENDIGYHEVIVKVEDEHGYKDFQIVRFLVYDLPEADLNTRNLYFDVDNSYASIEDFYILDGSKSNESILVGGDLVNFTFIDNDETFAVHKTDSTCERAYMPFYIQSLEYVCDLLEATDKDLQYLLLPLTYNTSNLRNEDITILPPMKEVKTDWFSNESFSYIDVELPSKHELALIVTQEGGVESQADVEEIYVAECLPHNYDIDDELFLFPPYPYNDTENFANVCCEPVLETGATELTYGTFKSSSQPCFEPDKTNMCWPKDSDDEWIEFEPLNKAVYESSPGIFTDLNSNYGAIIKTPQGLTLEEVDLMNDIFELDYSQKCSNYRGNVCSGTIVADLKKIESCNDFDDIDGQFARCQGPDVNNIVNCQNNVEHPDTCENYTYPNSFEEKYWTDLAFDTTYEDEILDGLCGESIRAKLSLSDIEINEGNFSCNATCNSGACDYWQEEHCSCTYGDDECNGLQGNLFFDGAEYFVCTDEGVCDGTCTYSTDVDNNEESCYCAVNSPEEPSQLANFKHFLDVTSSHLTIAPDTTSYTKCCLEGVYVFEDSNLDKMLCANGEYEPILKDLYDYEDDLDRVLISQAGSTRILICGGDKPDGWSSSNHITSSSTPYRSIFGKYYECMGAIWVKIN